MKGIIAKKTIILYVLKMLKEGSSLERPLTNSTIAKVINSLGLSCDRKTVGRNIGYLIDYGYKIEKTPKGYYFLSEDNMCLKKNKKNSEDISNIVIDLIVEEYRFMKSYKSLINKLLSDKSQKYLSTYNFHCDKLNEIMNSHNIKYVELEGMKYDDGLSVNPLNIEDFEKNDELIIEQVIEPLLVTKDEGKILKSGTVILAKIHTKEGK
ncbi:MAG: hypothetical protein WCQ75_00785 [Bacilli bacterium]